MKKMLILSISIALLLLSTGCIDSRNEEGDSDPEEETFLDTFQMGGNIYGLAQSNSYNFTEEIHFEVPMGDVASINITISLEDGDENTEIDTVEGIRMWRESGGEPEEIKEETGGNTPYQATIQFEYPEENSQANWWIVEVTGNLEAGEDQWRGPLFWRGVSDQGMTFQINAEIVYNVGVDDE